MNFLVTAIGSFSADCVINSLKSHGHKVVGCDIYPSHWHAVSKDCDKVYQAPFATKEKEYIDFLLKTSEEESVDYIIPLTDLEIDVLNRNRFVFNQSRVSVLMQSENCLKIARNKLAMYKLFKDSEIVNLPYSIASENLETSFPLPAIAKPTDGRSSEGLMRITNIEELSNVSKLPNYIIQEMLPGSVFTVDYIRDNFGNDFAVPREELLRTKNGAGTTVRIAKEETLVDTVSYIGNTLGVIGCVNMEFIKCNNTFFLIDINPRFSAGVAFTKFIGYDMVKNHLNCFLGKAIEKRISYNEQIIAKRFEEVLIKEL